MRFSGDNITRRNSSLHVSRAKSRLCLWPHIQQFLTLKKIARFYNNDTSEWDEHENKLFIYRKWNEKIMQNCNVVGQFVIAIKIVW